MIEKKVNIKNTQKQFSLSLLKILGNPITLTVLTGILIVVLLPTNISKINAELIYSDKLNDKNQIYYYDLNSDGTPEKIELGVFSFIAESADIKVFDGTNAYFSHLNLKGQWPEQEIPVIGDYDSDGFIEFYFITVFKDSVFFHGIEFLDEDGLNIQDKFICKSNLNDNGIADVSYTGGKLYDFNKDGFKDLYIVLAAGYSRYPRNIFRVDLKNNQIISSPLSGTGISSNHYFKDMDGDSIPEFFGLVQANGNYETRIPYKDSSCFLMVFDTQLQFKFEPVEFPGYPGKIDVHPIKYKHENFYLCLYSQVGAVSGKRYELLQFDAAGSKIDSLLLPVTPEIYEYKIVPLNYNNERNLFLQNNIGQLFLLRLPFRAISFNPLATHNELLTVRMKYFDIDNDGFEENIMFSSKYNLTILDNKLDKIFEIVLNKANSWPDQINPYYNNGKAELCFQVGNNYYMYRFSINPFYKLRFLIYMLITLLIYSLFYLLNRIQKKIAQEKFENEKHVLQLQYNSIKNQIDPHFSINVLNSISGLYSTKRIEEAERNMIRFSRLMQQSLMNSDRITVTLEEELDFCRNFIEIQQTRFANCFEYKIIGLEGIDTAIEIPRMLIHTFVENAIKHGLVPKGKDGLLKISTEVNNRRLLVRISDNGIGRIDAKKRNTSGTGKGLQIVDKILGLYKKISGKKISYTIIDNNMNESDKKGTTIEISIPTKQTSI